MPEKFVRLGPREQQIADLLLQGCDNEEIAKQLKMARRTVKAHFNRLFLRFGITGGIKRVKLATLLYRRQLCSETSVMENESPMNVSSESLNSLPKDLRTAKLRKTSELLSTSSRTIYASSTTSSDSGIASSLPSGMRRDGTKAPTLEVLESWERSILDLENSAPSNHHYDS